MTVAIAVKVFDGLVLATDSATTLTLQGGSAQVWNNANKIFHLHRRQPIGAMTWGAGNIGSASIATVAKDLRRRLMGGDPEHADWALNEGYTIEGVAERAIEIMYDELYQPEHASQPQAAPPLGLLVAGYPAGRRHSEAWLIMLEDPTTRPVPQMVIGPDQSGWLAYAQPQASLRLGQGYDPALLPLLTQTLTPEELAKVEAVLTSPASFPRLAVVPSMPFADAISFARYLVDVTVGYSRFMLGPDTVGGPVEVAGISKHEGFKWVSRKHYYPPELNPEDPGHDY